ncbi:MAG: transposase [Lentisphaerae bacterium]|nr:transposase [Lentisphaerota bacterium]
MRVSRIKETGSAHYHIMSRIVDRQMLMNASEKEYFRKLMRAVAAFSGCQVITHGILTNHWHCLLHVPERPPVTDEELIVRLAHLYDAIEVRGIAESLQRYRDCGEHAAADAFKARFTCRMYDLSEFVKTLKQRYTQSYNRRHGRKGTLWEERYKSVLIGGRGTLLTVAAYIDLNAVRAGIVEDPGDYRFCGYGEAVGGSQVAREGLMHLFEQLDCEIDWKEAARLYRQQLFVRGEQLTEDAKPGFSPQAVQAVLDAGGILPKGQALRCRVRYFSDGVILGSRSFVEEAFLRHRNYFSAKRTTGARPMKHGQWDGLCTARRLRMSVIQIPQPA